MQWDTFTVTSPRRSGRRHRATGAQTPPLARPYAWAALIVAAGILTYANGLSTPPLFDDVATFVGNTQITDLANWRAVLLPEEHGPLSGRPIVSLTLALNYALSGPDIWAFHATNLALHLVCALLIFGIVRRTLEFSPAAGADAWPWQPVHTALAVALLWTVHPLNSEVVLYTTQRSESLMAACYLLALYGAARSLERAASGRWAALTVAAVVVGVGCKETIATAPIMVVLYDRAFGFDSFAAAWRSRWRVYAGLAATWILLGTLVAVNGQSFSAGFSSANVSSIGYFLNQPQMLTQYLWLTVWPQSLVLYYGWPRALSAADVWPYAAFITTLFVLTLVALVRRPRIGVLGAAFFLTLGPTSSFIPIATEVGAERRMYLAVAALLVLAVAAVAWLRRRFPRTPQAAAIVLLAVVSIALASRTVARSREYASALTMAQTVLDRWPSPNAHYLVGVELAAAGRRDEAITHLREASQGYPPSLYYLGRELFNAGRFDESATALRGFVMAEPAVAATRPARLLTARALEAAGRPADAIAELTVMLADSLGGPDVHGLLANLYSGQQEFDRAVPHYREYLKAQPRDGDGWTGLGIALISVGRQAEAIDAFRWAVDAQPGNDQFRANLARALGR